MPKCKACGGNYRIIHKEIVNNVTEKVKIIHYLRKSKIEVNK